jgi:DNA-nicking Smr family endonuclease
MPRRRPPKLPPPSFAPPAPDETDHARWEAEIAQADRLKSRERVPEPLPEIRQPAVTPEHRDTVPAVLPSGIMSGAPAGLDGATLRRIRRGRMPIERRLDLHDMTQAQAWEALQRFILRAQADGLQLVLVITGKGTAGKRSVLREQVPHWCTQPPVAAMISGVQVAARSHGGEGALYVRLKRRGQSV